MANAAEGAVSVQPPSGLPLPSPAVDELLPLARLAAGGDARAARTLVTAVGGAMLRAVRKVMGADSSEVEDVAQDAVFAFISALPDFRGESSVIHFASRIAVLTAMAARRRAITRARFTEAELVAEPELGYEAMADRTQESPLDATHSARRREVMRRLLDELPEQIAEALALHFILGYTVEEIAATCGVPSNTVWSRLRLGKQGLRKRLADPRYAEVLGGES